MQRLSLTFDNGPTPGITETVLDTLDEYGVKATFFLVGRQLEDASARRLAERAFAAGHRLGNHSYSHGDPLGLRTDPGGARAEIMKTYELLGEMAGSEPLYRPNGHGSMGQHLLNSEAVETLDEMGASVVLWNSVPRDRKVVVDSPELWVEDARRALEEHDWTVMVLHDRPSGFDLPGPMIYLRKFLEWACGRVEFRQDFAPDCTPILHGEPTAILPQYMTV